MNYESEKTVASAAVPGVTFTIARISLGRRIELVRRMWELAGRAECAQAGQDAAGKLEATLLTSEIDRAYVGWGLLRVEGLALDGQAATPESLIAAGPEELCREIVAAIKSECGLTEAERKN